MFDSALGLDDLRACLASNAPIELRGMGLLREQPHLIGGFASVPRPQLVDAVTEIVAYTGRCAAAARRVGNLSPIPLKTAICVEFGI